MTDRVKLKSKGGSEVIVDFNLFNGKTWVEILARGGFDSRWACLDCELVDKLIEALQEYRSRMEVE